jgi:phosphoglycerate dehydrogenase-like enzyme
MTADFYDESGAPKFADMGLAVFEEHAHIKQRVLGSFSPEIAAEQIRGMQGVIVLTPAVTKRTVAHADDLLVIGRFGVGYDGVDVQACTDADVAVCITSGAVDRPVAEATLGWMIALCHHMRAKDQLVRSGQWASRTQYMGRELRDRTLGIVGLGGIARGLLRLLQPFGMRRVLACDPVVDAATAAKLGVQLVDLDTLLRESDFVSLHCPLNDKTRGLIGARQIAMMKPDAYLLNTARGGIVDEDALYDALANNRIAGAAVDCFATEPVTSPHRFGELENVLLAPHCIAWTDELFRDIGRTACQSMVDASFGRRPHGLVNPQVLDRPGFKAKWARLISDKA